MRRLWIVPLLAAAACCQQPSFRWPDGARAAVSLTYDDGIDVHLDIAMPDLEAAGLRGTFYVPGNSASLLKRMEVWRAAARRGHELGNHTLFHPCLREIPGRTRTFVIPERMLENYTVRRIADEVAVMNAMLFAVDGLASRTYAYTCGDETAGGASYVDSLRPMVHAARAYSSTEIQSPQTVDLHRVPSWGVNGTSGADMIAWAEKGVEAGALAVFTFHGVGGGHNINIGREEHGQLLAWLAANRKRIWVVPFGQAAAYIAAQRKPK